LKAYEIGAINLPPATKEQSTPVKESISSKLPSFQWAIDDNHESLGYEDNEEDIIFMMVMTLITMVYSIMNN